LLIGRDEEGFFLCTNPAEMNLPWLTIHHVQHFCVYDMSTKEANA
jgi:hypothetical protein